MSKSQIIELNAEYTDTFGGVPNYEWVKRETFQIPDNISKHAIVRRLKKWAGLSAVRCRVDWHGDVVEIRPYRICRIIIGDIRY